LQSFQYSAASTWLGQLFFGVIPSVVFFLPVPSFDFPEFLLVLSFV